VTDGLDLETKDHAKCGSKMVKAAAVKCQGLLGAESKYQKSRTKPTAADKRSKDTAKVRAKFTKAFDKAKGSCPTTATTDAIEGRVDAIVDRVVHDTLNSAAAGDGAYITIAGVPTTYEGRTYTPVCIDGSPYKFFARRGTVNKLVMYYQGGGACWEQSTCSLKTCDQTVGDGDNPANANSGFADLTNPANPFRDWNVVFVSYCTGDIHFGNAFQNYTFNNTFVPIHHRGFVNAQVVEKWAREHFVAPDELFITGSSAGAYGAIFNSAYLMTRTWPAARAFVLGDAGNGVITDEFLQGPLNNWNFDAHLPRFVPALDQPLTDLQFGEVYPAAADFFPNARFAQYTTAFDGGLGGQTSFYQVMLHPTDIAAWQRWWEASCVHV
jgi:hypothetical protein